jgi:hypothetical protein
MPTWAEILFAMIHSFCDPIELNPTTAMKKRLRSDLLNKSMRQTDLLHH